MPTAMPKSADRSAFEVPRHVAIIMDGNGRWAAARGLPRGEGHRRGVEALRKTVRAAGEIGISYPHDLLLQRGELVAAAAEIRDLMGLLRRFIRNDLAELHQNGVQGARDRRARRSRRRRSGACWKRPRN